MITDLDKIIQELTYHTITIRADFNICYPARLAMASVAELAVKFKQQYGESVATRNQFATYLRTYATAQSFRGYAHAIARCVETAKWDDAALLEAKPPPDPSPLLNHLPSIIPRIK